MVQAENPPADSHLTSCSVADKESVCYSHNHMWIDVHDDKSCHIGIDAFLATFLRDIDRLSFITSRPPCLPTAVMTVRGADLYLTFPERMHVTGVNAYLRVRPSNLTRHPYTLGWLFEGVRPDSSRGPTSASVEKGLISGHSARQWLRQESRRLTDFVRTELTSPNNTGVATMTDGGTWSEDLITHLTREETLRVWSEFFSISAGPPAS